MPERRFPPPWSVEDPDTKLGHVRDADGHKGASPAAKALIDLPAQHDKFAA
jgi:hypothetical protein